MSCFKRGCGVADDRFEQGLAMRKSVMGADHVARAEANKTDLDAEFQRFITETAWGDIWNRPGLDRKTRHMVTLAIIAALGRPEELAIHIRATRNTGVTPAELREIFMQLAVYGGVPAANSAFAIAKRVYAEMEDEHR